MSVSTYNQQSPRQCSSQLPAVEPAVGLTPSSAMFPSGGLSPYKPPHPTPQDSLNASVRPIETCPPRNRRRRSRTIYNGMQINGLEACFKVNRYPDIETRENLAMYIGMSEARVQVSLHIFFLVMSTNMLNASHIMVTHCQARTSILL